jgi:hypothetical protein
LWWENKFSIPPTSQIPFIHSSPLYVSSSLFALQKPARSPLPSWKHTRYKVSPTQNTFSQPDFSASCPEYRLSFPLNGLPEIPPLFSYSFAYPPASSRTLLLTYLSSLFSPILELPRRTVPRLMTEYALCWSRAPSLIYLIHKSISFPELRIQFAI